MEKKYFVSLTGLRAIAASMVFFHHFNPFTKGTIIYNLVNEFHIGVTIFFVLSGFLIGYRYSNKNINYKQYFLNRFARIYPVFFIFTLLTFIMNPSPKLDIFLNFTLLKGFFQDFKFSGIAQGWTLTVEECFYAFALLLFYLVSKRKILIISILPVFILAIGGILLLIFREVNFHGFLNNKELIINYTFFGRSFEFISGFLLSYFLPKIRIKYNIITYLGFFGIIVSIFLLVYFKGDSDFGSRSMQGKIINNYILPIIGVLPIIFGLLTEKTIVSQLLSSKILEILGKSSYTFYIIHMGVLQEYVSEYVKSYYLLFIIMQVFSYYIFKYYEEPINVLIRKMYKTKIAIRLK